MILKNHKLSSLLLTRDSFRESCLERDGYKCLECNISSNLSVHHVIERRLWDDGGYYIENGITLCDECHMKAEATILSCEHLRALAKIKIIILPDDFYSDQIYTKWGDVILQNGTRMKGPLFSDESVQRILKWGNMLSYYVSYIKYPRSYHLPWSEGQTKDDRTLKDCDHFVGKEVVITQKMDGENSSLYNNYFHARSIDGRNHWSRSRVKNLQAIIGHDIPEGWRICGENLQAVHSLKYDDLESYFQVFSIWNDFNECLSWDETIIWCQLLNLTVVKEVYRGIWNEEEFRSLCSSFDRIKNEGFVVRLTDSFSYFDFKKSVAKFVRKEHIGTTHNWKFTATEENELKV